MVLDIALCIVAMQYIYLAGTKWVLYPILGSPVMVRFAPCCASSTKLMVGTLPSQQSGRLGVAVFSTSDRYSLGLGACSR